MSVEITGRSAYPSSFAARSTSRFAPTRLRTSPRSIRVSVVNGIGSPPRTSFRRKTPRPISEVASSHRVFPTRALLVTTASRNCWGKSRSSLSSTSGPIPGAPRDEVVGARRDRDHVPFVDDRCRLGVDDRAVVPDAGHIHPHVPWAGPRAPRRSYGAARDWSRGRPGPQSVERRIGLRLLSLPRSISGRGVSWLPP